MLKDIQGAFVDIGDVILVPVNDATICARVCGYEGFHQGLLYLEYGRHNENQGPRTVINNLVVRANNEATAAFNAAFMRG
jgi:hypothetical protein